MILRLKSEQEAKNNPIEIQAIRSKPMGQKWWGRCLASPLDSEYQNSETNAISCHACQRGSVLLSHVDKWSTGNYLIQCIMEGSS